MLFRYKKARQHVLESKNLNKPQKQIVYSEILCTGASLPGHFNVLNSTINR